MKSSNIEQGDRLPEASRFNAIEAFAVNFGMDSMLIDQAQSWLKASIGQAALQPTFVADRNVPEADNHALEDRTFNATVCEVETVVQIWGSTF